MGEGEDLAGYGIFRTEAVECQSAGRQTAEDRQRKELDGSGKMAEIGPR